MLNRVKAISSRKGAKNAKVYKEENIISCRKNITWHWIRAFAEMARQWETNEYMLPLRTLRFCREVNHFQIKATSPDYAALHPGYKLD